MLEKLTAAALACGCTLALVALVPSGSIENASDVGDGSGTAPSAAVLFETKGSYSATAPEVSDADLAGTWQVVGVGAPTALQETSGSSIVMDSAFWVVRTPCFTMRTTGAPTNGRFIRSGGQTIRRDNACADAERARDTTILAIVQAGPDILPATGDRLRLRSTSGELLLERGNVRLSSQDAEAFLDGGWQVASFDGQALNSNMSSTRRAHVEFSDGVVRHRPCPEYDFAFRIAEGGRIVPIEDGSAASAASLCHGHIETAPDVEHAALRLLRSAPQLEIGDEDTLIVTGETTRMVLTRVAPERR